MDDHIENNQEDKDRGDDKERLDLNDLDNKEDGKSNNKKVKAETEDKQRRLLILWVWVHILLF